MLWLFPVFMRTIYNFRESPDERDAYPGWSVAKEKKNYLCKLSKRDHTIVLRQYSKSPKSGRWIVSYIKIPAMMEGKLFRKQFNVLPPHYENDLLSSLCCYLASPLPKRKKNMSLRGIEVNYRQLRVAVLSWLCVNLLIAMCVNFIATNGNKFW